jgi:hypothetical protein
MSSEIILFGDVIVDIGRRFIEKPYRAGTLEGPGKERLVVDTSGFDCTTFVEIVLALARCADGGKITRSAFRQKLQSLRYRQGKINGYASRLHYFTDWIYDNKKMGFITDLSKQLGGNRQQKKINYMTRHRAQYPALHDHTQLTELLSVEKKLSRRFFYMLDEDTLNKNKGQIKNGDIIAFASKRKGLDVAHVGFAFWKGKSLRLLHASQAEGRVVISQKTLVSYLKSNRSFTGVIVAKYIGNHDGR